MSLEILKLSRPYIWSTIAAKGPDSAELTTLPVQFAFVPDTAPDSDLDTADWFAGSWADTAKPTAQCLIGPGGVVQLDRGRYRVYIWVVGAVVAPMMPAGTLLIT